MATARNHCWQRNFLIKLFGLVLIFYFNINYATAAPTLTDGLSAPYPAPPLQNITAWINSDPLELNKLRGKVILIDFWAYSCINCVRTLPYLKAWDEKYHDQGLVIIGVHSPEFSFETNLANVKMAVAKYGIKYPVALDNDFTTWRNYNNQYWPAHYLIDKNGQVVYQHFGEGDYGITENNIRSLLGLAPTAPMINDESASGSFFQTPETYLGYERGDNFDSPEAILKDTASNYSLPAELAQNGWALQGNWTIAPQQIVNNTSDASIQIKFYARKVFLVAGGATHNPISIKVLLNGQPVAAQDAGKDVHDGILKLGPHNLYTVLNLPSATHGVLELKMTTPGAEMYTFTFGN